MRGPLNVWPQCCFKAAAISSGSVVIVPSVVCIASSVAVDPGIVRLSWVNMLSFSFLRNELFGSSPCSPLRLDICSVIPPWESSTACSLRRTIPGLVRAFGSSGSTRVARCGYALAHCDIRRSLIDSVARI
jgi:hypothetical protein